MYARKNQIILSNSRFKECKSTHDITRAMMQFSNTAKVIYFRPEKGTLVFEYGAYIIKLVRENVDPPPKYLEKAVKKQALLLNVFTLFYEKGRIPYNLQFFFMHKMSSLSSKKKIRDMFMRIARLKLKESNFFEKSGPLYMLCLQRANKTLGNLLQDKLEVHDFKQIIVIVLYTLLCMHRGICFIHGDLHISNILLNKVKEHPLQLEVDDIHIKFISSYEVFLNDLEYSYYDNEVLGNIQYEEKRRLIPNCRNLVVDIINLFRSIERVSPHIEIDDSILQFVKEVLGGPSNILKVSRSVYSPLNGIRDKNNVLSVQEILKHPFLAEFREQPFDKNVQVYKCVTRSIVKSK